MEQSKSENTKRLSRNTLYLYFRSIFCLILSLYSSRLILQALGVDDYGINNVVAGFASMFTLVTGSLSSAIGRFLTFELGTGDENRLKQVFSISVTMMVGFSFLIFLLAITIGQWYIRNVMTIPEGRELAALWAFYCAIISVVTGLIVSPYNSSIIAHEKMGIYAIINIIEAILQLGLALYLTFGSYSIDRLILYTVVWTTCGVLLRFFAATYATSRFKECRFRLFFEKHLFQKMFSFAGWNFMSNVSGTLSGQGVNLLINFFYGTAVNAARGLSDTVQRSVSMFVNNFTIALSPQITKSYASDEMSYVKYLTYRGSRFAFYIMFLIALPVILEAEFVFTLWLGNVPEHTVNFNRIALIDCSMGLFSSVFATVQNASGNIRNFSFFLSLNSLLQFPLAWLFFRIGFPPEIIYFIIMASVIANIVITHHFVSRTLGYNIQEVMREVYLPEFKVILCSIVLPLLSVILLPYGWPRFLITCTLCVLSTVPAILYLGCNASERVFIYTVVRNRVSRITRTKA
ncbi:MAG: lipopolysaccharide biosynthesis protein [Bacteroidales bacterium]|nr:lipopolysaccharide biosynthesis protein [Bacteroidales bacterium]